MDGVWPSGVDKVRVRVANGGSARRSCPCLFDAMRHEFKVCVQKELMCCQSIVMSCMAHLRVLGRVVSVHVGGTARLFPDMSDCLCRRQA